MRLAELKNTSAEHVLAYVNSIHHGFSIPETILAHPQWRKTRVPLNKLHIPDEEGEDLEDPYNRVQWIDYDQVKSIDRQYIETHPIVVDTNGHIIDGNHRTIAAKLGGLFDIPAYIPTN
jgi:hypothetical protein